MDSRLGVLMLFERCTLVSLMMFTLSPHQKVVPILVMIILLDAVLMLIGLTVWMLCRRFGFPVIWEVAPVSVIQL